MVQEGGGTSDERRSTSGGKGGEQAGHRPWHLFCAMQTHGWLHRTVRWLLGLNQTAAMAVVALGVPEAALARPARCARSVVNASSGRSSLLMLQGRSRGRQRGSGGGVRQ